MKKIMLKYVAVFCAINILFQVSFPVVAYALTGGPSQPEVQSFEPIGTSEMVDVFSGDFNYNIPLMDVEGYPINISYHAGISMDQEASWVGLGWNINPGVINRNMRGLPDDFNGDIVEKQQHMADNCTWGADIGGGVEIFSSKAGIKKIFKASGEIDATMGVFYNTYKGVGYEFSVDPSLSMSFCGALQGNAGLSAGYNSQDGFNVDPSVSVGIGISCGSVQGGYRTSVSAPYNSRQGLKSLVVQSGFYISHSTQHTETVVEKGGESTTYDKGSTSSSMGVAGGSISKIDYGTQTYLPSITTPMINNSTDVTVSVGPEYVGVFPYGTTKGYCIKQKVKDNNFLKYAFGYLNTHKKTGNDVLLDFNREKDGAYTDGTKNLPLTNYSYDIFNASGQGVAGCFRPYRGAISYINDDHMETESNGLNISTKVGVGNLFKASGTGGSVSVESQSGIWSDGNMLYSTLANANENLNEVDPLYEPCYFKMVGEKTPVDMSFNQYQDIDKPFRPFLSQSGNTIQTQDKILKDNFDESTQNSSEYLSLKEQNSKYNHRRQRDKRTQLFSYLTVDKSKYCFDENISSYNMQLFDQSYPDYTDLTVPNISPRLNGNTKPNHITEVSVTKTDGMKYIYGLPAYNNSQDEYTFTTTSTGNISTGTVNYDPGIISNSKGQGIDEYYNKQKLPAYAYAYLLTGVVSPDYVDVNGNGIDDLDLGTATKFNYTRVNDNYQWRTPYLNNSAYWNEGYKTELTDNKGSVVSGTKEIWMLRSVETKNFIANFVLKERNDGYGASSNLTGTSPNKSYCLDRIELYSKYDLQNDNNNNTHLAKPIKVVHFIYDYSLCPGVENNISNWTGGIYNPLGTGGKLTLKQIYFTYGDSKKGKFSTYTFNYPTSSAQNPRYNIKSYDRWGNYKPNSCAPICNSDFPYVDQNKNATQDYIKAWNLQSIDLPSGGRISIEYESDDYAYVQDKQSMQMFKVVGFNRDVPDINTISNNLYDGPDKARNILFFKINSYEIDENSMKDASGNYDVELFKKEFFNGVDNLYFNFLMNLNGDNPLNNSDKYEYVRGYMQIDKKDFNWAGVTKVNNDVFGWVRIQKVTLGDGSLPSTTTHPASKAAWQFARLNLPYIVYPGSDFKRSGNSSAKDVVLALVGFIDDLTSMLVGFNENCMIQRYGSKIKDANANLPTNSLTSWIRLNSNTKKKLGGGYRVKKIQMSDNWATMGAANGGATDFAYGQEYDYTVKEGKYASGSDRYISSGVASYEPIIGNEENPWRQPIGFDVENFLAPDDHHYVETPFGESFFPSPMVGYSHVTVRNLQYSNIKKHATGKLVYEFYTAKDFPVITKQTDLMPFPVKPESVQEMLRIETENYMTTSQGYMIELNDMHGKPKSQFMYQEKISGTTIVESMVSGMKYVYLTDANNADLTDGNDGTHLYNTVDVIDPKNNITQQMIGIDVDMVADMKENTTETNSDTYNADVDAISIMPFLPFLPIPVVLPNYVYEKTQYRSAVITKVVHRFGLVKEAIAYQEGHSILTQNKLYDSETGNVLLTSTQNEYEDDIYNLSFPAHWQYKGMESGYKTQGAVFTNVINNLDHSISLPSNLPKTVTIISPINNQSILVPDIDFYLCDGDVVLVHSGSDIYKLWIYQENNKYYLMDENGNGKTFMGLFDMEIIQSGRRNMQNTSVGSVSSLNVNPIHSGSISFDQSYSPGVLHAGANTYYDKWSIFCCQTTPQIPTNVQTPIANELINLMAMAMSNPIHAFNASGQYPINLAGALAPTIRNIINSQSSTASSSYQIWTNVSGNVVRFYFKGNNTFTCPLNASFTSNCFVLTAIGVSSFDYQNNNPVFNKFTACSTCINSANVHCSNNITIVFSFNTSANYDLFTKELNCEKTAVSKPNPFLNGTRNIWRQQKSFAYNDQRMAPLLKIRKDGPFQSFTDYWSFNTGLNKWQNSTSAKWVCVNEVLNYSSRGFPIESKDALGRYSASQVGYNTSLPVAVASNTMFREIAFDGFEDYDISKCSDYGHFSFKSGSQQYVVNTTAHSGRRSIKVSSSVSKVTITKNVSPTP